jgi:hypothetical protein
MSSPFFGGVALPSAADSQRPIRAGLEQRIGKVLHHGGFRVVGHLHTVPRVQQRACRKGEKQGKARGFLERNRGLQPLQVVTFDQLFARPGEPVQNDTNNLF